MKSLTGKFASGRRWTLLLILFLGAGLFVAACGDEEVPAPTTPAPPPPPPPAPEPEPEPEPPAVPTGLRVSATGMDFIEWSWTPVEDVSGYDVQFSANEAFTNEDEIIARTAEEISYRRDGLEAGTSAYLRVRSATGADDDRVTSDWSTHVTGMTMEAPPPPAPPATPTGLMVSEATETSITWTWNEVAGALGYVVQVSTDEMFDDAILGNAETVLFDGLPFTTQTSYTAADLEADTTLYVRVAAAAGTPTAPLVSAFTTHATGMTMAATLAAPANVRVKNKGSNYIEWEWDEVEGADGYQAHFSTDSGFSDPNPFEIRGASSTTQRVANLDAESDGYFRVRAYAGTVTDRMFGDWSEANMATTDEPPAPPPPEPLDTPTGVATSEEQDNSITVTWAAVDDAETYQVEQSEDGGDWVDASCGSENADNEVDTEECVASGLSEDTEYEFRVKAFPDSDDTTLRESEWSDSASGETTGDAPPPPITGGSNDINLAWTSDADEIVWDWDPVADREQRGRIQNYVALLTDTSQECPALTVGAAGTLAADTPNTTWIDQESAISADVAITDAGEIRGLCVVRSWEDDRKVRQFGDVSLAWASTPPAFPTPSTGDPNPSMRQPSDGRGATQSITWRYETDEDFDYELRILSANREDTHPSSCSAGDPASAPAASTTNDVVVPHVIRNPAAYSSYQLCIRAVDPKDYGQSSWQKVGGIALTRPSAPAGPRLSSDSEITTETYGGQNPKRLVWTVGENNGTPRDEMEYEVTIFESTDNITATDALQTRCSTVDGDDAAHTATKSNASTGIEVRIADSTGFIAASDTPDVYYFYACVRANPENATPDETAGNEVNASDQGLWSVNKVSYVGGQPAVGDVGSVVQDDERTNTTTRIYFEWTAVEGASYEVQFAQLDSGDVDGDSPGVQTRSAGTTPRYTVSAQAGQRYSLRVRYTLRVGGRTLRSEWSTAGALNAAN